MNLCGVGDEIFPRHTNVCNSATLQSYIFFSFQQIAFKLFLVIFKAFSPAVLTKMLAGFYLILKIVKGKKKQRDLPEDKFLSKLLL